MDPNAGKKGLYNTLSPEQLKAKLQAETFSRRTLSFYRYVILTNPEAMRDRLYREWQALDCLGRIYIAREGINAQMNVPEHHWQKFLEGLNAIPEFANMPLKLAVEDDGQSFIKLTVKVRERILADGLAQDTYDVTNVGSHLNAEEWNRAMEQGALVVDMRNHYESEIGHFENAILPQAETFREELPEVVEKLKGKENKKILLYCTGGIRCEKTSAYLKHHGFKDVNQLHGGIIDYARQIKTKALLNKFKGKNFVFDERMGESISQEIIAHCHQCGAPCDTHVNCANVECNLLFIQCEACAQKHQGTCSPQCREVLNLTPEQQKERRKGTLATRRFYSHRKVQSLG